MARAVRPLQVMVEQTSCSSTVKGPPENAMQWYMTVHVTCQIHVSYMTFNISDMHFDMSEHFEHVVCHATIHVIYHVVLPMKMCLHHNS